MTSRPGVQVLIVEDEPKLLQSIAEGMRLEGWDVSTAETGMEALRHLKADSYDLLVLDWMLPDYDGMELLADVRRRGLRMPVLVISARVSRSEQITAFQGGATDFMPKPFGFIDLLARSRALLAPAPAWRGR